MSNSSRFVIAFLTILIIYLKFKKIKNKLKKEEKLKIK